VLAGKPLALSVLKNNPALRFYERFGFSVISEAGVKFEIGAVPSVSLHILGIFGAAAIAEL
jgi:ribosomal protein S18 acetylase RimI-like enzyme